MNIHKVSRIATSFFTIGLLSPALSGCFLFTQRSELIKETENLSKSLETGSATLMEYFNTLNTFDREGFKLILSLNSDCRLEADYVSGDCQYFTDLLSGRSPGETTIYKSPLEISPYISNEALNARLQLLSLLSVYAKSLSILASDESPEQFKKSISNLRAAGISLNDRIKSAGDTGGQPIALSSSSLDERYLTPLSEIIGILGKIYLNESKWSAIRSLVNEASPYVDTILASLETDVELAESAYRDIAQDNAGELLVYYNKKKNLSEMTRGEKKQVLDAYDHYNTMQYNLKQIKNEENELESKAVGSLITPIRKAHGMLAGLATGNEYDLIAEIRALIATYDTEIQEIRTLILKYDE